MPEGPWFITKKSYYSYLLQFLLLQLPFETATQYLETVNIFWNSKTSLKQQKNYFMYFISFDLVTPQCKTFYVWWTITKIFLFHFSWFSHSTTQNSKHENWWKNKKTKFRCWLSIVFLILLKFHLHTWAAFLLYCCCRCFV